MPSTSPRDCSNTRAPARCSWGSERRRRRAARSPTVRARGPRRQGQERRRSACWVAVSAAHEQAPPATRRRRTERTARRAKRGARRPDRRGRPRRARARAAARHALRPRRRRQVASRLAELVAAASPARVVKGRCLSYGEGVTFWPLAEAAKTHAGILDTDPPRSRSPSSAPRSSRRRPRDQAERVLERRSVRSGSRSRSPSSASRSAPRPSSRLQDGWTRYLDALGQRTDHDRCRRRHPLGLQRGPRSDRAARREARRHADALPLHRPARVVGDATDLGRGQAERDLPLVRHRFPRRTPH